MSQASPRASPPRRNLVSDAGARPARVVVSKVSDGRPGIADGTERRTFAVDGNWARVHASVPRSDARVDAAVGSDAAAADTDLLGQRCLRAVTAGEISTASGEQGCPPAVRRSRPRRRPAALCVLRTTRIAGAATGAAIDRPVRRLRGAGAGRSAQAGEQQSHAGISRRRRHAALYPGPDHLRSGAFHSLCAGSLSGKKGLSEMAAMI